MHRILVIDDDTDILNVVSLLLTINGYLVETLCKWQNTFERIDSFKPDVILLDISLGGEDGRNISQKIKLNNATKNVHIILFSAHQNFEKDISHSMANDFLNKPFETKDLLQKINSGLQKLTA